MPTITIVGQVFDKHRAVAFGIASSGCGIGKFLCPVLLNTWELLYGWRGAVLLVGGLVLNICTCAMLYIRSPRSTRQVQRPGNVTEVSKVEGQSFLQRGQLTCVPIMDDIKEVGIGDLHESIDELKCEEGSNNVHYKGPLATENLGPCVNVRAYNKVFHCEKNFPATSLSSLNLKEFRKELALEGDMAGMAALSTSSLFLETLDNFTCSLEVIPRINTCHVMSGKIDDGANLPTLSRDNPEDKLPEKIFKEGLQAPSVCSIPAVVDNSVDVDTSRRSSFNFFLFRNIRFVLLCLNNLLFAIGYAVTHIHLPAFAVHAGIPQSRSGLLLSAIGISSIVGKIGLGVICQHRRLSPVGVYTVSFMLSALVTFLVPACKTFTQFALYATFYGFISGSFGSVLPALVVSMFDLGLMPSAYGFLMVFEALGFLLGPCIAGWIYDGTGFYPASFYFGGLSMMVSALLMLYPWYKDRQESAEGVEETADTPCVRGGA